MIKKHKKILLAVIGVLLVGTLSLTYGYFAGGAGPGANTDINLTASRTEKLIFNEGDPINLLLNEVTLAQGGGNVTGESTATATLIASETTNNSAANYNVYLNINFNNFIYTTPTNTPEIIAEITDPTGAKITSITGLTYTTVTDNQGNTTTGFDITNKVGRFDVKLDEAITSTDSVTGVTENWTIKVTYINLDTNQAANANKSMDIKFVLDQRDNVLLNEIADADTFATTIAEVTNDTAPLIDEMRFSSIKSADYETASLKWDVSANTGSEEVIAYIEDHPTDGRILHIQANGDVVFYSMKSNLPTKLALVEEKIMDPNSGVTDIDGNYVPGSLTNDEINIYCSGYGVDVATCVSVFGVSEDDIKLIIPGEYFGNVDYINMGEGVSVSDVMDMSSMFEGSTATTINVSGLDTSNVTNMSSMFRNSVATTINLTGLDTSKVTDMSSMFRDSVATTINLTGLDTSEVTDMSDMFYNSAATTINLTELDTSKATDMSSMFYNSAATTINVSGLDTSNVTNMSSMFYSSDATTINLTGLDTSKVTDMSSMFYDSAATTINLTGLDTSNVTDMSSMFRNSVATVLDVSGFDTGNVTDMSSMFYGSDAILLDVSGFDTGNVTDMSGMFGGSWNNRNLVKHLDLSNFNTSKVTDMSGMFFYCYSTVIDVSGFNTSNVTDMSHMFYGSEAIVLDVSGFDTSKVTNMSTMLGGNPATIIDLSGFDTSKVTDMSSMFRNSAAITLDVSGFDTSNVTDMNHMFESSDATVLDVSGFDFSLVTDAGNMLYTSSNATTNIYVKDSAMQTWLEANADPYYVTFVVAP